MVGRLIQIADSAKQLWHTPLTKEGVAGAIRQYI
jgi:hypothetical protein